ncbi:MAG: hypothetical protein ABSA96_21650 [Candidatus Acidiferrales bacterium]|jgi:hypothetical protein
MNKFNLIGRIVFSVFLILPATRRLTDWVSWMSLCIALPLAIWLASGWIGLLCHWQVVPRVASVFGTARPSSRRAYKTTTAI